VSASPNNNNNNNNNKIIVRCYNISTPSAEPVVFHDKHTNTLNGKSAKLLNVNVGGSYSLHWSLTGLNYSANLKLSFPLLSQ
jgi:hypothetical protein